MLILNLNLQNYRHAFLSILSTCDELGPMGFKMTFCLGGKISQRWQNINNTLILEYLY
jgi:hypothetical protein